MNIIGNSSELKMALRQLAHSITILVIFGFYIVMGRYIPFLAVASEYDGHVVILLSLYCAYWCGRVKESASKSGNAGQITKPDSAVPPSTPP